MDDIEIALWVNWIAGREYQVSILRSPFGLGTHRFVVPESSSLLTDIEAGPSEDQRDVRRRARAADRSPLLELREQGDELSGLVFAGENRDPFRRSMDLAIQTGAWLRLRLTFQNAPAAADWPWEALVVEGKGQFLANLPRVSFERTPGLAQSVAPPPVRRNGILRILILCASPEGFHKLDIKREKARVAAVFRKAGIKIKVIAVSNRSALDKAGAASIPFDILHVICHGDFEENGGVLLLEGEAGASRLTSRELTALLRRPPALVFLNACHSARGAHDPFSGFAESLLRAGTSAVIGMRRPITEKAAQEFAPEFYRYLAAGEKVAHALAKWREQSLRNEADWAVPVLYLGCEDFALLTSLETSPPTSPDPKPQRPLWVLAATLATLAAFALTALVFFTGESSDPRCPSPRGLDLPMVFIPAGSFDMGSDKEKVERPVHRVTITKNFCLSATEITAEQYAKALGAAAPAEGGSTQGRHGVAGHDSLRRSSSEARARSWLPTAHRSAMGIRRTRRSSGRRNGKSGRRR